MAIGICFLNYPLGKNSIRLAFTLMLRVPQHDNTLSELVPTYNWLCKARDNNNLCLKGFLIPLSRQTYGV